MIICPWCGTTYETFRSNCKNCGGPIQVMRASPVEEEILVPPPPAPREISPNYALKLMQTDAAAITGLVLTIVGGMFTSIGILFVLILVTAFLGIPFALLGMVFLLVGGGLLYWRYQEKQKVADVLKYGQAARGEVTGVEENLMVRVNHRHPWVVEYQFHANGRTYSGKNTTFRCPMPQFQPGKPAYVLYHPDAPERNALYPHP